MKKTVLSLILAIGTVVSALAAQKYVPDFAYPQDVISHSEKDINLALSTNNDTMLISGIVQYSIAETSISNDNFPKVIAKIDSAIGLTSSRPVINALLHSIKAQSFASYYNDNRYKFNSRKTSINPLPEDVTEWSASQMKNYIVDLLDKSLENKEILLNTPLTLLGSTVEYNEWGLKICPDVYRFLLNRSYNILNSIYWKDNPTLAQLITINKDTHNDIAYLYYVSSDFQNNKPIYNLGDRYKEWKEIYDKYSDTEYCGLMFNAFESTSFSIHKDEIKGLYNIILDFKARYPKYPFMSDVETILNNISSHSANCSLANTIPANTPAQIQVTSENVNNLNICVYRCPENIEKYKLKDCKLIHTIPVSFTDTIPFYSQKDVELPPLNYGKYVLVMNSKNGDQKVESRLQEFRVTDLQLISLNYLNQKNATLLAVNGATGKPMRDVTIKQYEKIGNNQKYISSKSTGKDYAAIFSCKERTSYNFYPSFKNDKFAAGFDRYQSPMQPLRIDTTLIINTDLAVYRPGATVRLSIVAYSRDTNTEAHYLVTDSKFRCGIYNISGTAIDTVYLTTDSWGRAAVEYSLPKDGMNGHFEIRALDDDRWMGYQEFEVSEYKAPTFYVEFNKTPDCFPADMDTVSISGKVCTYSGVPLSNSIVKGELGACNFGWYDNRIIVSVPVTAQTDGKGEFTFNIPHSEFDKLDTLSNNDDVVRYNEIMYTLSASCTSQSGETQTANTSYFSLGELIDIQLKYDNIAASTKTELPILISSYGLSANASLYYTFTNVKSKEIYSGYFNIVDKIIDLSKVPSGEYIFEIFLSDKTDDLDELIISNSVVIYRVDDKLSPVKSPLWVPVRSLTQSADGSVSFIAGSNTDTYIYYVAYTEEGMIATGWLEMKAGQHKLKISLPKSLDKKAKVELRTVKNYRPTKVNIEVIPYTKPESISLSIESFRDKATAGDTEHWRFKLSDKKGNPVSGAVMLDVYNAALDAIRPSTFAMNIYDKYSPFYAFISSPYTFNIVPSIRWIDKNSYKANPIMLPMLNTYGIYSVTATRQLKMAAGGYVGAVADLAENRTSAVAFGSVKVRGLRESAVVKNDEYGEADEEVEYESADDEDASVAPKTEVNDVKLREGELTNALWMPYLTTDASGYTSVEFNIPNYNTTLALRALAYNSKLLNTSLSKKIVVSKPIMVQPNMPRFLRNGDDACISSLVINNSDSEQQIKVKVEIYNPLDSTVYLSSNETIILAAGENRAYSIKWKVPEEIALMGYRIIAANGNYSDGEQNVIPVLEAVSPIVESQTFYLNPGERSESVALRKYPANSRITLSYCDNPAWLCLTALPSIFNKSSVTATGLTNTLFSAFTARGISNQFPAVEEAITYWQSHPQDSMLVSALSRNSNLKIGSLENSPWVSAAASQTMQMESISKLLDKQYIDGITSETITALKELQNANGSFSWFRNCTGSFYITSNVLRVLGEINEMGYLPSDNQGLNSIITKAVNFLDTEVINIYNNQKNKKDYSVFQDFAYIRAMYPDYGLSKTLQELTNKGINQMLSSWKSKTLTQKAYLIILLCRNGRTNEAMPIYKSILQYAIHTKDKGTYWDKLSCNSLSSTALMLTAIKSVDTNAPIIDKVRQWLLIQKQTNQWSASADAAKAVYALLSSGTDWMQPAADSDFSISLGSETINKQGVEKFTGSLLRDIKITAQADKLTVSRSGNSPAWGAVIAQYAAPMASVKAISVDGLSISKTFYDMNGNQLSSKSQFRVGDKVRVMLTVKNKQAMDYVMIHDERAAAMEPVNQISEYTVENNVFMYREIKDDCVNLFISHLSKGTHTLYYDVTITAPGEYSAGVATVQSQYAPELVAHSAGIVITTISSPSATE